MTQCFSCKYRDLDGHEEPCIGCKECGIPYIEGTDRELKDMYEEADKEELNNENYEVQNGDE